MGWYNSNINMSKIAVTGGTFDLLHKGHKEFIKKILRYSDRLIIGLTSEKYVQEHKPDKGIDSYENRKETLLDFLKKENLESRVEIMEINDMYGPLLDSSFEVDNIAVAPPTKEQVEKIQIKRVEHNLHRLNEINIELERAEDSGFISATRIRNGEIDREGKLFVRKEWDGKNLLLPSTLREKLQDVWGEVVSEVPVDIDLNKTITVGDITTQKFINSGKIPRLSIVDFKVERKEIPEKEFENVKKTYAASRPGEISYELFDAVKKALKEETAGLIVVDGEEDLSVLPALLCVPLGFCIFYGQPGVGMVKIETTEDIKRRAYEIVDSFKVI